MNWICKVNSHLNDQINAVPLICVTAHHWLLYAGYSSLPLLINPELNSKLLLVDKRFLYVSKSVYTVLIWWLRPTCEKKLIPLEYVRKQNSVQLLPSSFAVISVSSCKSWSTHGLKSAFDAPSVFPGEVEVVSVPRDLTSMKPITKHRTTTRTGVKTDRRAMANRRGEKRRGVTQLSADLMLRSGCICWVICSLCQLQLWPTVTGCCFIKLINHPFLSKVHIQISSSITTKGTKANKVYILLPEVEQSTTVFF